MDGVSHRWAVQHLLLGVKLVAHQGDSRRRGPYGRSSVPPAGFFFLFKDRDVQSPRPTPATSSPSVAAVRLRHIPRRPPQLPWSPTSSSLDVCGCACCDIFGLSADGAARSAAAVARKAQPRINFFGCYENSTNNQGAGTSGSVVQNLW